MNKEWMKNAHNCQSCGEDFSFKLNYLRGIGDTKISKACDNCKDEYFEQVKSQYFVEKYKGETIYKWNGFYFPYWDAQYAFNTIEECKARIDNSTSAVVNMGMYHLANSLLK